MSYVKKKLLFFSSFSNEKNKRYLDYNNFLHVNIQVYNCKIGNSFLQSKIIENISLLYFHRLQILFSLQFSFYALFRYSLTSSDEISYSYRDCRPESYTMLFAKKRQDPFVLKSPLSLNHPIVVLRRRKQGEGRELLFGGWIVTAADWRESC